MLVLRLPAAAVSGIALDPQAASLKSDACGKCLPVTAARNCRRAELQLYRTVSILILALEVKHRAYSGVKFYSLAVAYFQTWVTSEIARKGIFPFI